MAQSTKKTDAGRIPGPIAIPNCIEVILNWNAVNQRLNHTVLHARNSGGFVPSVASANTLFTAITNNWLANLALYAPANFGILRLSVRDMTLPTLAAFISTLPAVIGTSASTAMPPNVALVLSGHTGVRGRGNIARAYIPDWAVNADSGSGTATAAVQTAMNTFGTTLLANFSASSMTSALAKPARQAYTGLAGASHPQRSATTVDINSWVCADLIWDSQRSRTKP